MVILFVKCETCGRFLDLTDYELEDDIYCPFCSNSFVYTQDSTTKEVTV